MEWIFYVARIKAVYDKNLKSVITQTIFKKSFLAHCRPSRTLQVDSDNDTLQTALYHIESNPWYFTLLYWLPCASRNQILAWRRHMCKRIDARWQQWNVGHRQLLLDIARDLVNGWKTQKTWRCPTLQWFQNEHAANRHFRRDASW